MSGEMAKGQAAGESKGNKAKKRIRGWVIYKRNNQSLDNRAGCSNKGYCVSPPDMLE